MSRNINTQVPGTFTSVEVCTWHPSVRGYFEILEDTLMARWLPSYRKRPKRRVINSPKLYFADVGVVGFLARRGRLEAGSELFENAFENWCFHEITAYNCKECHPSQSSQSRRFVCAGWCES
jgi:predicted AAA+ superfamily ATPase